MGTKLTGDKLTDLLNIALNTKSIKSMIREVRKYLKNNQFLGEYL